MDPLHPQPLVQLWVVQQMVAVAQASRVVNVHGHAAILCRTVFTRMNGNRKTVLVGQIQGRLVRAVYAVDPKMLLSRCNVHTDYAEAAGGDGRLHGVHAPLGREVDAAQNLPHGDPELGLASLYSTADRLYDRPRHALGRAVFVLLLEELMRRVAHLGVHHVVLGLKRAKAVGQLLDELMAAHDHWQVAVEHSQQGHEADLSLRGDHALEVGQILAVPKLSSGVDHGVLLRVGIFPRTLAPLWQFILPLLRGCKHCLKIEAAIKVDV
mmetsp:Transcript_79238/g.232687  ORF Transcript_79238/g.232687 Transcript_79238/m.232687 type:complete len:267 (-) Transcript_79238:131-931(-)